VQRPPHGPGLDQAAIGPQPLFDVGAFQVVDAGPQRQFRRRHELSVKAPELTDQIDRSSFRHAFIEVMLLNAPCHYPTPIELRCHI